MSTPLIVPHDGVSEPSSLASQHREQAAHLNPNASTTSGESLAKTKDSKMIPTPLCYNMVEHPSAPIERAGLNNLIKQSEGAELEEHALDATENAPLRSYLKYGLAYTIGSALTCLPPPTREICLQAFLVPNKAGLTAGARAWSKHAHRSGNTPEPSSGPTDDRATSEDALSRSLRWWGTPSGPVARINERAVELFWRVWRGATWKNLHWLPHQVLVYEIRVPEGYGMRWAQDHGRVAEREQIPDGVASSLASPREEPVPPESEDSAVRGDGNNSENTVALHSSDAPWVFRGFVEPMMENGHEVGWRH